MEFNKEGMLLVIVITCLLSTSGAAIVPVEKSYTASVGDDVHLTWSYGDENDMFSVDWTFLSDTTATPESIMTQTSGSSATAENNYDVEHIENGKITLKSVKMESSGKYFCAVSYKIGSGLLPVTGTATLTVKIYHCRGFGNSTLVDSEGKCICAWLGIYSTFLVVPFLIGIGLGCKLKCATCCCDSFYNGESCKDCVNNYNCKCKCCPTPCSAFCNIRELPYWYQILWASVIGSPVAFGIWVVWRCCPNGMRKKYMQDDKSELLDDDGNTKDERLCDNEQTPKVHPESRGRGIFPPQPSPLPGTSLNNRKGSGSVVSRRDVEMHETDTSLQRGQLPNIQTPGHDNKGRGLSANFGDDDHPLVAIDIPTQKADALPTITETP